MMYLLALTPIAEWLNNTFGAIDLAVATFANSLHEGALGGFFDLFFKNFTHLGDEGILFIALGILLLLFARTRKGGASMLIALLFGLLMTNLWLKLLVARPRPYMNEEVLAFNEFWAAIGHGLESEAGSFPSGHTTSAFAAMFAGFWAFDKRYSWTGLVFAALLAFSRIYVQVHYFSDILGGMLVGFVAGTAAFLLMHWLFTALDRSSAKGARFISDASLENVFLKLKKG